MIGSTVHPTVIVHNTPSTLQPPLSLPAHVTLSTSCPQQLDSQHFDQSLDSLQLTQMEIDAIRNMGRPGHGSHASSPSTPTSQLSHPDFVDPRPDIYRFVYDVSPGSRSRTSDNASVTAEGGDVRSSESQQDSRFDEIVIASMERPTKHHIGQQHRAKTVTLCEGESSTGHYKQESLPTSAQSAASVHTTSESQSNTAVTSTASAVQNSDLMVVSVGDALVAVQPTESMASVSHSEVQQLPVTSSTSGPIRHKDSTSLRIHKGRTFAFLFMASDPVFLFFVTLHSMLTMIFYSLHFQKVQYCQQYHCKSDNYSLFILITIIIIF